MNNRTMATVYVDRDSISLKTRSEMAVRRSNLLF